MPLWSKNILNFTNMNLSPTFLKWNTKIQGIKPMGLCKPLENSFINEQNNYQNIYKKTNMASCWKSLDHSQNNCAGLTQWAFVPLVPTLTYTNSNLNNLRNWLEANQFIDFSMCNKNRNPCHNVPQAYRGGKYVCPFWIQPTDDLQSPKDKFQGQ